MALRSFVVRAVAVERVVIAENVAGRLFAPAGHTAAVPAGTFQLNFRADTPRHNAVRGYAGSGVDSRSLNTSSAGDESASRISDARSAVHLLAALSGSTSLGGAAESARPVTAEGLNVRSVGARSRPSHALRRHDRLAAISAFTRYSGGSGGRGSGSGTGADALVQSRGTGLAGSALRTAQVVVDKTANTIGSAAGSA